VLGGLGAGLGGGAVGGGAAAAIEIVGEGAGGVEVVDGAGVVEVGRPGEGTLVEDVAECGHGAVTRGVAALHGELREPGGAGLLFDGLCALDAEARDARVGIALAGGGEGAVERPDLGVEGGGGEQGGDAGEKRDERAHGEGVGGLGVRELGDPWGLRNRSLARARRVCAGGFRAGRSR